MAKSLPRRATIRKAPTGTIDSIEGAPDLPARMVANAAAMSKIGHMTDHREVHDSAPVCGRAWVARTGWRLVEPGLSWRTTDES